MSCIRRTVSGKCGEEKIFASTTADYFVLVLFALERGSVGLNSLMKFSCRRSLPSVHWASLLNTDLLIILQTFQTELKLRQVYVGAGDSCHKKLFEKHLLPRYC